MIQTLTGENALGLQAALRQQLVKFTEEHGDFAVEKLDGEEVEFARMRESLESLPFLSPRKLVVLRTPSANKEFTMAAADLLQNIPETTDVIVVEPKLDKRSSYYKFLSKKTDFRSFHELDERGLAQWLMEQAKEQGGSLSASDARLLIERVGMNQQGLALELQKLVSYQPEITRDTILLLTDAAPHSTIFELLDAALAGDTARALQLYQEQRSMKVEPQHILALFAWQLHALAVAKAAGNRDPSTVAREARLNPFVVRKTMGVARRLSLQQIKRLVQETLRLDVRLKSEPIDADEALMQLFMRLTPS